MKCTQSYPDAPQAPTELGIIFIRRSGWRPKSTASTLRSRKAEFGTMSKRTNQWSRWSLAAFRAAELQNEYER